MYVNQLEINVAMFVPNIVSSGNRQTETETWVSYS